MKHTNNLHLALYEKGDKFAVTTADNSLNKNMEIIDKAISDLRVGNLIHYGFHVNESESNPSTKVTYLKDAVGMTPAKMNYTTGVFDYGSWKDAFFMPRPCMLKSDGHVDYYLNDTDYSKKADGTDSDITNENYDGNAMMEWGKNGHQIWYKIEPDTTSVNKESYSVYIANYRVDGTYNAWSFYNADNELMEHFYTPIYSGSLDSNGKLRSLSGKSLMYNKTGTAEISYAKANGSSWNIEVFADKLLMFLLLYLMGKSLDVQSVYGQGHSTGGSSAESLTPTGTLDDKGLFYGYSTTTSKVKVFGMEDQWGEQWNRTAGLMLDNGVYKYKLTEGTADGTTLTSYPTTSTDGMLDGGNSPDSEGYVSRMSVKGNSVILPSKTTGGGSSVHYCDYYYQNKSGVRFALLGGDSGNGSACGFCVYLDAAVSASYWDIGAALSCKPKKATA